MIEALRRLEAELNGRPPLYAAYPHPINLNVGMIRGGDWPSTVAGECVTHFRLALSPGERVATSRRASSRRRRRRRRSSAFRFEVLYDGFAVRGLRARAGRAAGRRPARAAARTTGAGRRCSPRRRRPTRAASTYGDTPAVCFGPVAENEHGVDERVHLPSITQTAQAIALFIADSALAAGEEAAR